MVNKLVSLITPCYNTGQYIHRLLDSVLIQTYDYIEMLVIDDGSTDNSAEIIKSYISKFNKRGYTLTYLYQSNSGQSVAIENGIKQVTGDYLAWPDSDDWYDSPKAIEKMVTSLEDSSKEFAMVRTMERVVSESNLKEIKVLGIKAKEEEDLNLFEDCLFDKNGYYFCAGAYMVRMEVLKETTHLSIYTEKNAGQNWQLMLPVLYKYRCKTIKEVLYNVLERSASHSRGQYIGYEKLIKKYSVYEKTIQETLKRTEMDTEKKKKYQEQIILKYSQIKLGIDFDYKKRKELIERYDNLEPMIKNSLSKGSILSYWLAKTAILEIPYVVSIIQRIRKI